MQCTLSGLDSVTCMIEEVPDVDEGATTTTTSLSSSESASNGFLAIALQKAILVSPFFFWGTSMVAMKSVVPHSTPLLLGALRLLPAGAVLVGWAAATGRAQPSGLQAWAWVMAFALVDAAAFQGFLAEGLTRTSAGLGSVIIDSQPLSVALLASLLFGERLSGLGFAGLALGVAGLALLNVPGESLTEAAEALASGAWLAGPGAVSAEAEAVSESAAAWLGGGAGGGSGLGALLERGEFWMLLAAQSMAVGTVMVRYVTRHVDPIMATGWHMVIGGALLAAAAAATTADPASSSAVAAAAAGGGPLASLAAQLSQLTPADAAAMAYVSLMGGAASYGVFFWNASHGNLTSLSSLTFLTPVFASAAGYLALGEVLSPMQLLGGAVTLSAVWAINHRPHDEGAEPAAASAAATVTATAVGAEGAKAGMEAAAEERRW